MLEITPYSNAKNQATTQVQEALRALSRHAPRRPQAEQTPDEDRVELSQAARDYEAGNSAPVSSERIQELRAQIEAGTYLTPDKIDYVVERLFEELSRG